MAGKLLLKLKVGFFDQPVLDKSGNFDPLRGETVRRTSGEIFEASSQEEYDRLIAADAAADPEVQAEQDRQDLEARRVALEAERDRIDAQLALATPADDLKGKALDEALTAAGLSTDGTADEKRARLAEQQASAPSE